VGPGQTITLDPGFYPGGFDVRGNLILRPGIYVLGGNVDANAQANIQGDGVLIYTTNTARLNLQSTGTIVNLRPPDPSRHSFVGADVYSGINYFQGRNNRATSWLPVSGNISLEGLIYLPNGQLNITASGTNNGLRLLVYRLQVGGTGEIVVRGRNIITSTSSPFLVQ
jgi:hypothetical protein